MTHGISPENSQMEGGFSERTMFGLVGYTLFLTYSLVGTYSAIFSTGSTNSATDFGLFRGVACAGIAGMLFLIFRFMPSRDAFVRSTIVRIVALLMQLALPILTLTEELGGLSIPFPIVIGAWLCWGASHAVTICAWIDTQSRISETYVIKTHFYALAIAGLATVGILTMMTPANLITTLVTCIGSFALLQHVSPRDDTDERPSYNETQLRQRIKFNHNGSYILLIDGVLLGFSACFLAYHLMQNDLSFTLIGAAFLATALLFFLLQKFQPALLSLEHSQLIFLPVLICGLLFMEFSTGLWAIAFALLLFVVLLLFDFTNESVLALRGNLLSASPSYCFSRGRVFLVVGQGVGWTGSAFLLTDTGKAYALYVVIALAVLLCLYIAIAAAKPEKYPLVINQKDKPIGEFERPYKRKCAQAAQRYDLTPRESEILFYLAKGRNANFIAGRLFVAERTIKTHTYHIYQKMDIHSQQELINIVEDEE